MAKRVAEANEVPLSVQEGKRLRRSSPVGITPANAIPPQWDVDEIVAARKAEILALHRAMKQARSATNTRAWQLLPRHLRRRAASHNVLRLPRRLRAKARAELRASNTDAKTRSAMRKRDPERTLRGYIRRRAALQARAARPGRRWLETHLWHAKRFRMTGDKGKGISDGGEGRWGFCLAETPHQKSERTLWRKTSYALVHDHSYTSIVRITATAHRVSDATSRLQLFLYLAGIEKGWQPDWTTGAQRCDTVLLDRPRRGEKKTRTRATTPFLAAIAPVQVWWTPHDQRHPRRDVHVFVHPAAVVDVKQALAHALDALPLASAHTWPIAQRWTKHVNIQAQVLESAPPPSLAAGMLHSDQHTRAPRTLLEMQDVPRHAGWNVFEVLGDRAAHILGGVLHVAPQAQAHQAEMLRRVLYQDAAHALPSAWLPPGTALSCDIIDPRLTYPPKNTTCGTSVPMEAPWVRDARPVYADARFCSYTSLPRCTQAAIDQRRAQHRTEPASYDTCPILLFQRTWSAAPGSAPLHGYTLLVPRGWGAAVWRSLVHTGAHVVGQAQWRALHLHLGHPLFPDDWIGHAASLAAQDQAATRLHAHWAARPPAKRVPLVLDVCAHPFGGAALWQALAQGAGFVGRPVLVPCVDEAATQRMDQARCTSPIQRPSTVTTSKACTLWTREAYEHGLARRSAAIHAPLPRCYAPFVLVLLTACRRGAWDAYATMHMLPLDAEAAWRQALDPPRAQKQEARVQLQTLESSTHVTASSAVGAVTRGDYALSTGHGRAIAVMTWTAWLELERRERQKAPPSSTWGRHKRNRVPLERLVLVRNAMGGPVRAASVSRLPTY
ncbi:tRNA 5'-leader removal protein [Malassezia pachydermatis]|uniref:Pop1-domain-containing protein n=1 Tax=Malassezia pachydermatis TaxID=77020 RepID=A0A0M8MXU5_9BASI|nr:pop1-domain-containing protein [Malassezia pachydermatis]KOS15741.1 pop1-domain-containing protein [Malassezia pachydermatis]